MQTRPLGLSAESLIGTTTNDNAAAGVVGEVVTASWNATSMTSNTVANMASITLTPGDWDVCTNGTMAASSAVLSNGATGISQTSATFGAGGTFWQMNGPASFLSVSGSVAPLRFSTAVSITLFAVGLAVFASGTCTCTGNILARRAR